MPKINRTPQNPHGLSFKQTATIAEIVKDAKAGHGISPTKATAKIYQTKYPAIIANQNFNKLNFREALLAGLTNAKILGANSTIEKKLTEGLEATQTTQTKYGTETNADYRTRLAYIQEINKIAGVYAPERKQSMSFNVAGTPQELEERIKNLQAETTE